MTGLVERAFLCRETNLGRKIQALLFILICGINALGAQMDAKLQRKQDEASDESK